MKKFEPGDIYSTDKVNDRLSQDNGFSLFMLVSLNRHLNGDWGNISEGDKATNEDALANGLRLMSVYNRMGHPEDTIWIITEADRSVTTILFPDEY